MEKTKTADPEIFPSDWKNDVRLGHEFAMVINRNGFDAVLGIPDFVIAYALVENLRAMHRAIVRNKAWHEMQEQCNPSKGKS